MQRRGSNNIRAVRREIVRRRVRPTLAHAESTITGALRREALNFPKAMRGRIALLKHFVRNILATYPRYSLTVWDAE